MLPIRSRIMHFTLLLVSGGTLFGGCTTVGQFIKDFNYGGSVFAMTPQAYRFLTSGYEGPGVDPDIDPACTYPPFCDGDPFAP